MKYEYIKLEDSEAKAYNLDDINELGKEGWRVVWTNFNAERFETTLLERELK